MAEINITYKAMCFSGQMPPSQDEKVNVRMAQAILKAQATTAMYFAQRLVY